MREFQILTRPVELFCLSAMEQIGPSDDDAFYLFLQKQNLVYYVDCVEAHPVHYLTCGTSMCVLFLLSAIEQLRHVPHRHLVSALS